MKRSYEDRVRLSSKAGKHGTHKPNRNNFGIHKTKRHYRDEMEEQLLDQEMEDMELDSIDFIDPRTMAILDEYGV